MAFIRRPCFVWKLRSRSVELGARTLVMGVLNVTPDSFSDGGLFYGTDAAVERGLEMLDEGAELIDVGGESTRPGARDLSSQEEQERVLPVIEAILGERPWTVISVDTYQANTARAAIEAGAQIVNDVSGFGWDPEMAAACAEMRCGVVLMHSRGRPGEWRAQARLAPQEVLPLVREGLESSLNRALAAGVERNRIALDPGYGFGKVHGENYPLLAHQDELLQLGQPLLAGVSRKSFLGKTLAAAGGIADVPVHARGNATLAATTAAVLAGAHVVRVHEVRPAVDAGRIADAILAGI
jgi:dihydropteroate synthase